MCWKSLVSFRLGVCTARIRHRLGVALTRCVCRQYCTPAFGSVLQRLKSPAQTAPSAIAVPQEVARAKEQPVELRHEINDPVTGIPESQLSRKVYVFSPSALALPPSCSLCCEGADSWCCLPRIAAKSAMQSGGEKIGLWKVEFEVPQIDLGPV